MLGLRWKNYFFILAILCLFVLFLFIKFYIFNKTIGNEWSSLFHGMIKNWIFITIWDQNRLIYLSCFVHYLFYYFINKYIMFSSIVCTKRWFVWFVLWAGSVTWMALEAVCNGSCYEDVFRRHGWAEGLDHMEP